MSDAVDPREAEREYLETLYGEPLREPTVKASRQLLVMSLVLIAVVKFGATIDSSSIFPLKFTRADVLPSALCVAVVLLLLNFLPRIITDLGLFVEGEHRINQFIWKAKVDAAVDEASKVEDEVYGQHQDDEERAEPDDWWLEVGRVRDAAAKAEETMNARLGRQAVIRWTRYFRALGNSLVPVIAAVWSVALAGPPSWPSTPDVTGQPPHAGPPTAASRPATAPPAGAAAPTSGRPTT